MYVDNEIFEKWMAKLDGGIGEAIKYLKSLVNTSEIFDKDEKLLDNTDLCFMLHVSKRTLQRYRREGKICSSCGMNYGTGRACTSAGKTMRFCKRSLERYEMNV